MKGCAESVVYLNRYLQIELRGHKQYLAAAAQLEKWGYHRLEKRQDSYAQEETQHAGRILRRIFFLGGAPDMQDAGPAEILDSPEAQLHRDRALVARAILLLQEAIEVCRDKGDHGTRDLFEEMLVDEESHLHWLESQLTLIEQVGLENYLQQQIRI